MLSRAIRNRLYSKQHQDKPFQMGRTTKARGRKIKEILEKG